MSLKHSSAQKGRMNALFFLSLLFVRVVSGILATGRWSPVRSVPFLPSSFLSVIIDACLLYNWCAVGNSLTPSLAVFAMLPVARLPALFSSVLPGPHLSPALHPSPPSLGPRSLCPRMDLWPRALCTLDSHWVWPKGVPSRRCKKMGRSESGLGVLLLAPPAPASSQRLQRSGHRFTPAPSPQS